MGKTLAVNNPFEGTSTPAEVFISHKKDTDGNKADKKEGSSDILAPQRGRKTYRLNLLMQPDIVASMKAFCTQHGFSLNEGIARACIYFMENAEK